MKRSKVHVVPAGTPVTLTAGGMRALAKAAGMSPAKFRAAESKLFASRTLRLLRQLAKLRAELRKADATNDSLVTNLNQRTEDLRKALQCFDEAREIIREHQDEKIAMAGNQRLALRSALADRLHYMIDRFTGSPEESAEITALLSCWPADAADEPTGLAAVTR